MEALGEVTPKQQHLGSDPGEPPWASLGLCGPCEDRAHLLRAPTTRAGDARPLRFFPTPSRFFCLVLEPAWVMAHDSPSPRLPAAPPRVEFAASPGAGRLAGGFQIPMVIRAHGNSRPQPSPPQQSFLIPVRKGTKTTGLAWVSRFPCDHRGAR